MTHTQQTLHASRGDADKDSDAEAPLHGITVIDLTRVLAGPFCTQMLADLGARVIKVEQPGTGDDARQVGPFVDGQSAYFMSVNRNKESIALNLKAPADRQIFEALLETADVLIENFRPGTMEKLGYDWAMLHSRYPRLVFTSVSGFGQTGPYRSLPAYDMVVQAMGGIMSVTGAPDAAPARVGVSIGDMGAGLYAVIGTQSALLKRERSGLGERVDVSMLDCQVALLENPIARFSASGQVPGPIGSRHPSMTPFDLFKAADGWFVIAAGRDDMFLRLCTLLELPGLPTDTRFTSNALRGEHHLALKELLEERLASATCAVWCELLTRNGIPTGEYNTVPEIMAHPQVKARDMLTSVLTAKGTPLTVSGNPVRVGSHQAVVHRQPPLLDQDRDAILFELGKR